MKLKAKLMMFTAAIAFSATMANAAITAQDVVNTYKDAAYSSIQVVEGPTQIKVEAVKDGVKLEVIYDKATGDVLSKQSQTASASDAAQTGVEVSTTDTDFGGSTGTGDDANDDNGTDNGGSDDNGSDANDDNGNDDNGNDGAGHDVNDDNGSDGSGHDANDDNGGNDNGNDSGSDGGNDSGNDDN